ncbi:hypothetical protein [Thioalkalivibrio sp. HK1]|uniref:hypothetical protein n=1 Tax=Thioalkalivibrio sp. HK1 TaxID=1469245 RepID=UPI00046F6F2F|nr:hypothetical protein [Thioalkalivibrio sp. HK1]
MKRWKGHALFALLAVLALAPRSGLACSCVEATLDQHVDRSARIFIGRLMEARIIEPKVSPGASAADGEASGLMDEWERVEAIFEPRYRIKGEIGDRETLRTGMGGGDCGVRMEVGSLYMIFLDEDDLRIDICSGSRQIDRLDPREKALELKSLID